MSDSEVKNRLTQATRLVANLASNLNRVLQTVDPQAVLERIAVDRERGLLFVDGTRYEGLRKDDLIYFWYARHAAGKYVSSYEIEEVEDISDFKTSRSKESLKQKYPELLEVLSIEDKKGARIILPMPPLSG